MEYFHYCVIWGSLLSVSFIKKNITKKTTNNNNKKQHMY